MIGECWINGQDAYTTWGIVLGSDSFTTLLTPSALKSPVENKSAMQDGKRIVEVKIKDYRPKVEDRTIQITFFLMARNLTSFLSRYESFVEELQKGELTLKTKYQSDTVYHLRYLSCQQFTQFNGRLGKFILRLNEPNPKNRT